MITYLEVASAFEIKEPENARRTNALETCPLDRKDTLPLSQKTIQIGEVRRSDRVPMISATMDGPKRSFGKDSDEPYTSAGSAPVQVKLTSSLSIVRPKAAPQGSHANHRILNQLAHRPDDTSKEIQARDGEGLVQGHQP